MRILAFDRRQRRGAGIFNDINGMVGNGKRAGNDNEKNIY